MLILKRQWTQQPQVVVTPDKRWIDRGLIAAVSLGTTAKAYNARTRTIDAVVGTALAVAQWGKALGFYSTLGAGTTDRVAASLSAALGLQYTIIIRGSRNGAGGNNFGRLFDATATIIAWNLNGSGSICLQRSYNTTSGIWGSSGFNVGVPTVCAVTHDASGTNAPLMYINGVRVTTTTISGPVGTATANSTAYIGNNSASTRGWDGLIAEVLVFNNILSDGEIAELANPSRVWESSSIYIPTATAAASGFKAAWARRQSQIIGSGVR